MWADIQNIKKAIVRDAAVLHDGLVRFSRNEQVNSEQKTAASNLLRFFNEYRSNIAYRGLLRQAYAAASSEHNMCSEEAIVAFGKTICETVSRGEAYLFDTKDKKILENHLDRFLIGLIRAVEIDDSRMAIKIKMGSVAFHALELLGSFGGASIGLAHGNEQQQAAGIMAAFFGNKSYEWLIDEILDKAAGHIRCSRPELCEFGSRVFSLVYKLETYKFEHSEVAKKDCLITFLKTLIFLSGVKDNPYVTTSQLKAA